jgi:lysophospholipase L1-like esterase
MRTARLLFTALTATILLSATALTASAAPLTPSFQNYVALGDSYTSGPFIPAQRLDPLGCGRSTHNYPSYLADRLNVRSFTDVSCGGATTSNLAQPQDVPLGRNQAQFYALGVHTDLVTLGIGGNDYGVFGRIIDACPSLRSSDPTGNPCQEHFTASGVDTMKAALAGTQANIVTALRGVHYYAPHAKVYVIGYPRIAPESGYCPGILPFADGDYAWLNSIEEALNTAVANAAAIDGATTYVDTYGPSLGHDACATGGAAWINGQSSNLFAAAAYHPFRAGMAGMANVIYQNLT